MYTLYRLAHNGKSITRELGEISDDRSCLTEDVFAGVDSAGSDPSHATPRHAVASVRVLGRVRNLRPALIRGPGTGVEVRPAD